MSLPGVVFGRSEAFGSSDAEYLDTSGVGSVRVPHGDFLLSADFVRMGPHLSLSEGDTTVVVKNFFTFGKAPDLRVMSLIINQTCFLATVPLGFQGLT